MAAPAARSKSIKDGVSGVPPDWGVGPRPHSRQRRERNGRYSFPAVSRRTNFWILPVDVFGSGPNMMVRGVL